MKPMIGCIVIFHDLTSGHRPAIITSVEVRRSKDEFESRKIDLNDENSYNIRLTVFYPGKTEPLDGFVPFGNGAEAGRWAWGR